MKRSEKIIVDSGAANSAIGLDKLKKDYHSYVSGWSHHRPRLDSMTLVDGQYDRWVVEMMICIQSHCFVAEVIVFHKLGCNFLLGTNTIVKAAAGDRCGR